MNIGGDYTKPSEVEAWHARRKKEKFIRTVIAYCILLFVVVYVVVTELSYKIQQFYP